MKIFIQQGVIDQELSILNRCRMFLHVIFLSDISTGDGRAINSQYWEGNMLCDSPYQWPRMERPTTHEWRRWKQHLTVALSLGRHKRSHYHWDPWANKYKDWGCFFLEIEGNHLLEQKQTGGTYIPKSKADNEHYIFTGNPET